IDTGLVGISTNTTMTPNGDGVNDGVFFNYQVAQNISSTVDIMKDTSTVLTTLWGWGQNVRMAWNGFLSGTTVGTTGTAGTGSNYAPSGNYLVRIKAGGATDTSLT